ncbi:MAG: phytanoyl-CoA dioxygenase family protein [Phycisphaeraceae bacterium]
MPQPNPSTNPSPDRLADARDGFQRDGYAHLAGFLAPEQARALADDVDRYIADRLPSLPEGAAFYEDKHKPETLFRLDRMHEHDPDLARRWLHHPALVELATTLLGEDAVPTAMQMFGKAPRVGGETPAHQDGYYFKLEPNHALTLWAPLDPVDAVNGCVRYVVGSHRTGLREHGRSAVFGFSQGIMDYGDTDRAHETAVPAEPGDVIAHHALTIHRADPNPSDRRRWAIGLIYYGASARPDDAAREQARQQAHQQWARTGKL